MVLLPLKCTCIPTLLQMFLTLLLRPLEEGTNMWMLLWQLLALVLLPLDLDWACVLQCLRLFQVVSLLSAHMGYLHLNKAFLMGSFLLKEQLGVIQTALALCRMVLNTL